jgi:hypothetical protein
MGGMTMEPRASALARGTSVAMALLALLLTLLSCGSGPDAGTREAASTAARSEPSVPSIRGGEAAGDLLGSRPPAGESEAPVAPRPPVPRARPKPLYWGATIGEQFTGEKAPWDMRAVAKFQRKAGKGLSLISFYVPFADCNSRPCEFYSFPTTPLDNVRRYGAIPIVNWSSDSSPPGVRQPRFQLADLIRGRYDGHIRTWARAARDWGHPFFLRFDWEMNGFWFPWGANANGNRPRQFVKAWRHVHRVFTRAGGTNATWVWCPNVDFTRKLVPLERLYPGNRFVDWTCVDGFNWGNRPDSAGWMSFDAIFRSTYRRIARRAPRKPILIGEVGSTDKGGSKATWIRNFLGTLPRRFPKVRAFAWFDVHDRGTNWPIETSRSATRAFRRGIGRAVYRPNSFGDLAGGTIKPPGR